MGCDTAPACGCGSGSGRSSTRERSTSRATSTATRRRSERAGTIRVPAAVITGRPAALHAHLVDLDQVAPPWASLLEPDPRLRSRRSRPPTSNASSTSCGRSKGNRTPGLGRARARVDLAWLSLQQRHADEAERRDQEASGRKRPPGRRHQDRYGDARAEDHRQPAGEPLDSAFRRLACHRVSLRGSRGREMEAACPPTPTASSSHPSALMLAAGVLVAGLDRAGRTSSHGVAGVSLRLLQERVVQLFLALRVGRVAGSGAQNRWQRSRESWCEATFARLTRPEGTVMRPLRSDSMAVIASFRTYDLQEFRHAPGRNRTSARGLGNRWLIH